MGRKLHSKLGRESSVVYGWVGLDGKGRVGASLPDGYRHGGSSSPGFAFWRSLANELRSRRLESISGVAVLCKITIEPVSPASSKRFTLRRRVAEKVLQLDPFPPSRPDVQGQQLFSFGGA